MRKFRPVGCLIALCLALGMMAGCGDKENAGGGGGGTPPPAPPDYKVEKSLDGYSLDLTDAKSIGLATASALSAGSVRTSAAAQEDEAPKEPDEVLLVKETEEGLAPLDFTLGGDAISQGEAGVEVYQMTVQDDFTYISFISAEVRKHLTTEPFHVYDNNFRLTCHGFTLYLPGTYDKLTLYDRMQGVPAYFDRTNFMTNEYVKSYAVHNETGKIYAMAALPGFSVKNGLITHAADGQLSVYRPTVKETGELELIDLLPNKNAFIKETYRDVEGTIYILNSAIEKNDGDGIVYIKATGSDYDFQTGPDGRLYCGSSFFIPTQYYVNGVKTPVPDDARLSGLRYLLDSNIIPSYSGFICGKGLKKEPTVRSLGEVAITNRLELDGDGIWFNGGADFLIVGGEEGLYSIPVGYETDSDNTYATFGAPLLLIDAAGSFMKDVVVEGGIMRVYDNIFTVMSLTGTQRYLIVPNASGKPSVKLLSDTPVDPSNILIQPLN